MIIRKKLLEKVVKELNSLEGDGIPKVIFDLKQKQADYIKDNYLSHYEVEIRKQHYNGINPERWSILISKKSK